MSSFALPALLLLMLGQVLPASILPMNITFSQKCVTTVNDGIHPKMQTWSDANMARTRSARHKLLKFLRDNGGMETTYTPDPESTQADMCGTLEIVDNALRQPVGQPGSVKAEPYTIKTKSHWLEVHCRDQAGTLADIARLIAQHEQNIKVS